jgi:hypothetical protein
LDWSLVRHRYHHTHPKSASGSESAYEGQEW